MKYSADEYKQELEKVYGMTSRGEERDQIMKQYKIKLHQGLEVGDGVTLNMWSDSHAGTIVRRTEKSIWVKRDHAKRIGLKGMSDCQEYEYTPDHTANEERCIWSEKRGGFVWGGKGVTIGRYEYYDFSF